MKPFRKHAALAVDGGGTPVALLALLPGRRLYLWARRKNVAARLLGRANESKE